MYAYLMRECVYPCRLCFMIKLMLSEYIFEITNADVEGSSTPVGLFGNCPSSVTVVKHVYIHQTIIIDVSPG